VANAKWCVYMGVFALAPNMRFAYISLPGCQACAAPVYMLAVWCCAWSKRRIVRWFKKAYGRQLQRKGEGEFLRGAPRESQTHLPSKIFQRPFQSAFDSFLRALQGLSEWTIWKPFKSPYPSYTPKTMRNISKALRHRMGQMRNCLVMREALSRAWNRPRADMHGYGRV
jgi:hypothetical protein